VKILWFSNTPALASDYLNLPSFAGGWLNELNRNIQGKVELHVAFQSRNITGAFKYDNTWYYPIKPFDDTYLKRIIYGYLNKYSSEKDIYKFKKIVDIVKPDLIHIHGTENSFGLLVEKVNIPIVISIQGILNPIVYKYFSGLPKSLSKKKLTFKEFLLWRSPYTSFIAHKKSAKIEERILSSAMYIMGRTDWDNKITSIYAPNCTYFHCDEIMREPFYKKSWNKGITNFVLLHSTMNNAYYKGIEDLIKTAIILKKMNFNFKWQVAGLNKTDSIIKIAQSHIKEQIPDEVIFIGKLEADRLVSSLLEANIYIMTSHIENSSNSLCEAMLLGLPCIATNVGGTSSIIQDQLNGILVPDSDPWNLAVVIVNLSNNGKLQMQLSENARLIAHSRHNPEKISKNIVKIYKDILSIHY
jgi:glycosyltransferase involved in cell wall biosynthesis